MQDLINPQSQLQFGVIKMLNANLAEVFINKGIAVDLDMMIECEDVLDKLMPGPYGLLLNEKETHTFTPEAESYFSEMKDMHAMAVVVYTKFTDIANKYLKSFHEDVNWNLKVFYDREKALEWLESESI
ncbi:MAG: hypothetical protein AB8G77_08270 [Rhodothermales bacterium]